MRTFTCTALAALTLLFAIGTYADAAAWCAHYNDNGGTNCGFYTYQQCQAAVSGVGGYCALNLEGPPGQPPSGTRRKAQ
jgi:hypothetical protein